jgi:hypothetical protein
MPSGLIQIVAYGSQDIYLTSAPQITYFKVAYRKYSNFAMESVEVPLNGTPKFEHRFITSIPKTGDLIHKLYLKVEIPAINLIANQNDVYIDNSIVNAAKSKLSINQALLTKYLEFFKYNFIILNGLKLETMTIGSNWYTFKTLINNYKASLQLKINTIGVVLDDVLSKYDITYPDSAKSTYYGSDEKNVVLISSIQSFINTMNIYYQNQEKIILDNIAHLNEGISNLITSNEYFAWTEKLGFNLIDKCSVLIGGQEIVNMDSNYLDIYHMTNTKPYMKEMLNEMIGNVPELTSYSRNQKNNYILYIPIPAWFTEHSGNAFPLIALVYGELEIAIEFSSLDKCCIYNGQSNINNLVQLGACSLLVDYIFLDVDERKKFGQFSHEYLVQSVQSVSSENFNIVEASVELDVFHPVKELFWYAQEQKYLLNNKLYNKYYCAYVYDISFITQSSSSEYNYLNSSTPTTDLLTIYFNRIDGDSEIFEKGSLINIKYSKYYDDQYVVLDTSADYVIIKVKYQEYVDYHDRLYGIIYNEVDHHTFNPINTEHISFGGVTRTPKTDYMYYNGVMPYQTYKNEVDSGINSYSFSLHPHQFQPSGSCNFSLLKSKMLYFRLNNTYYNYLTEQETSYRINIYATNYNVLRISNGIGTLVFSS